VPETKKADNSNGGKEEKDGKEKKPRPRGTIIKIGTTDFTTQPK
jgi:hypothetical protein